jgi:hypothetical protein
MPSALLILAALVAPGQVETRAYRISHLFAYIHPETLINIITGEVHPKSWAASGGPMSVYYQSLTIQLVITHNLEAHSRIKRLLDAPDIKAFQKALRRERMRNKL